MYRSSQIATISMSQEEGIIWHRNMMPTISIHANVGPGVLGNAKTKEIYNKLAEYRQDLPTGYTIDLDGSAEKSVTAVQKFAHANANHALCNHDDSHVPIKENCPYVYGPIYSPAWTHRCCTGLKYYAYTTWIYGHTRHHCPLRHDYS